MIWQASLMEFVLSSKMVNQLNFTIPCILSISIPQKSRSKGCFWNVLGWIRIDIPKNGLNINTITNITSLLEGWNGGHSRAQSTGQYDEAFRICHDVRLIPKLFNSFLSSSSSLWEEFYFIIPLKLPDFHWAKGGHWLVLHKVHGRLN